MASTWRAPVRRSAQQIAGRAAQWGRSALSDTAATDLFVQAALSRPELRSLHDPVAAVGFLRDSWRPLQYDVKPLQAPAGGAQPRLATLLEILSGGVPALSSDDAVALCKVADDLAGRREPFERPRYAADIGWHAGVASSFAVKGRLLAAIVRFMACRHVIEIGTAYGMSARFLDLELLPEGRIVTIEASYPQADVAAEVLADTASVRRVVGFSHDVVPEVRSAVDNADLLFHDGEHSRSAYERDFGLYVDLLAPGAVVLLDDIHWEDARVSAERAQTYEGWLSLTRHSRVAGAWEIDGQIGLLVLT